MRNTGKDSFRGFVGGTVFQVMRDAIEKMRAIRGGRRLRLACLLVCAMFGSWGTFALAASFVSFQEGDLRAGSDKAAVGTNGTLVDAAYNMGATVLRSDFPATAQDGKLSRIAPTLDVGAGVVTNRADVHYLVTEHGAVDLFGRSLSERAELLISIAAPDFRDELKAAARKRGLL